MNEEKLVRFIQIAKENEVTSLRYETEKEKLFVSFGQDGNSDNSLLTKKIIPDTKKEVEVKDESCDGLVLIKAPFVGTFYKASAPDAAPYVSVGDTIKKGQVLCILEAMKIMNELKSEVDGVVEEVTATNGSSVEYGSLLFKVKPL